MFGPKDSPTEEDILLWVELFKVLGDKSRLTILALLMNKPLCVCEIVNYLGMTQPAVSQHLRRLKALELVKERKEGQWVVYRANEEKVNTLSKAYQAMLNFGVQEIEKVEILRPMGTE
ncbi:winged helix-turn-helix transcriptional regulator [Heliorestis acidaminivorans]|uniref:Winged helix-turn-helix transcriptional regulator n=1 Tax=Heliorestis acidaminivorans TaxID=553427 RepID=A0A6I0EQV7_9FIRM|nr:metalloregulator ArsR/SmtB family transcription factor [Heliorestis acidaminivorans]KAB2952616.1 winged helix-turn-helix transcriptional regulator [Heliorestis acidaminivorans]